MTSMEQWQSLLGLPLADALARTQAAGIPTQVEETCAPRHTPAEGATQRVIRVCGDAVCLRLTVSAFRDGDPDK